MDLNLLIAKNFTENIEGIEVKENFKGFYTEVICSSIISPNAENLKNTLKDISKNDRVRITLKSMNDSESFANYSTGNNINDFIENIDIYIEDEPEEKYILNIDIVKRNAKEISVYNLHEFSRYIESLSLETIFSEFNNLLNESKLTVILINEVNIIYSSNSIIFKSKNKDYLEKNSDRNFKIEKRTDVCNFINSAKYKLSYDDFDFEGKIKESLMKVFKKLEFIMALISISDRSELIEKNKIKYSISGYKTIDFEVDYKNLDVTKNLNQFTKICDWLYNDDFNKLQDKIGIARNIISISLNKNSIFDVEDNLLSSIKSSHEIYLKKNVEKYLEVKQEVSSNLFSLMNSISNIADTVGVRLRTNIKGIITFFVSIIITNSLSNNRLNSIFTKDITLISIGFIIISIICMVVSLFDAQSEINRFKVVYYRSKDNYEGILDSVDINNIFHDDKYLKEDIEYIKKKINRSAVMWGILIIVLSVIVFLLGDFKLEYIYEPIGNFINIIKKF